jgi:magnesium transporter
MATIDAEQFNSINFGTFEWINIDVPTAHILKALRLRYSFHHLDIDDCLSKTQMPKIDQYPEYLFIILHLPRFKKDRNYSIPEQVAIFLGKEFLVTVHSGEIKPINGLFKSYAAGVNDQTLQCAIGNHEECSSPAFLLYKLIQSVGEYLMHMLEKVIFTIEQIEEKVFDDKIDAVREVTALRHNLANLRRTVLPLRRVIHDLEKKVRAFSHEDMATYFSDLSDSIDRSWAILEECKEVIEIYKDTDYIMSSDRTNKILSLLTIIFTFSIPFTVLGTLYGMNVHLPGGSDRPWTFLGLYTTFYVVLASGCIQMAFMFILFRRLRWL